MTAWVLWKTYANVEQKAYYTFSSIRKKMLKMDKNGQKCRLNCVFLALKIDVGTRQVEVKVWLLKC